MYGKSHTIEAKEKIRQSTIEMWKNPEIRQKIISNPNFKEALKRGRIIGNFKSPNKRFHNTKPEREMKQILDNLGIDYIHNYPLFKIEHSYCCDFFIKEKNLIIEVDGKYWHNYPNYTEKDIIRVNELKELGYNVLRFWENEFDENLVNTYLQELEKKCENDL